MIPDKVTALVFPKICIFCKRLIRESGDEAKDFFGNVFGICGQCLAVLPFKDYRLHKMACLSRPFEGDPIPDLEAVVPFRYEEPVISALRALKFHDAPYIAPALSFFMGEAVLHTGMEFEAVIPVPLSRSRLRYRGYNQARLLAEPVAKRLQLPCLSGFLVREKHTRQQSRCKDPQKRAQNVKDAFLVPETFCVENINVLLVDDIFTTGHTVHEAARTLYEAGAGRVTVLTAASGRIQDKVAETC